MVIHVWTRTGEMPLFVAIFSAEEIVRKNAIN